MEYSPDGKMIVGASYNGEITAWETSTGNTFQPTLGTFAFAKPATYDYYYPDNILVRWNWDINNKNVGNTPSNLISVLESAAFHETGIIAMMPGPNTFPIYLSSHKYPLGSLAFSQDGETLASSSRSEVQSFHITRGKIHLWNINVGKPTATLRTPDWRVGRLAFSPDGKYLASDGSKRRLDSRKILVWDLTTHQLISIIDTDSICEITVLVFASDSRTLASGDECGKVDLWKVGSN